MIYAFILKYLHNCPISYQSLVSVSTCRWQPDSFLLPFPKGQIPELVILPSQPMAASKFFMQCTLEEGSVQKICCFHYYLGK